MSIRAATPADIPGLARVHVQSWRETYTGLLPDSLLEGITVEARERQWQQTLSGDHTVLVAEDEGEVIGFASLGPPQDAGVDLGLYTLYLLRAHQGQGIGGVLWQAALAAARARGARTLGVWVLETNKTRGFYERMGGVLLGEKTELIRGEPAREVFYRFVLAEERP